MFRLKAEKLLVVAVCGGRKFHDKKLVEETLGGYDDDIILVHGGAPGADTLADEYAKKREWISVRVPAQWLKFGKSAGPRRNQVIVDATSPDLLIAFPGNTGTRDMVKRAEAADSQIWKIGW